MKSLTIIVVLCAALSTVACGTAAIQTPAAPSSEVSQAGPETVEVTVYDREGLDTLKDTLDWAGYEMAPGYPQKLRFGQGWLVLAYRQ